MNEAVKKLLLIGDKSMSEMHFKRPGFTYRARGLFAKNKERLQKLMQIGSTNYIYKNHQDKACFQHNMAYSK